MKKQMPIGVEDFREIVRKNYYFVDKTDFIRQLIDGHSKVTLITRPRRFGKTLTLSMLDWFFSAQHREESRDLFKGLAVEKAGSSYMEQQGQYPVLFLSLKEIKNSSWKDWPRMLQFIRLFLSRLYAGYRFLRNDPAMEESHCALFDHIVRQEATEDEMALALSNLMDMLAVHFHKPVILLLDEYDVPVQQAWEGGYYEGCIGFMRQFLSAALKTNPSLEFAVLTGVLRIAKESIFSGLNNLKVCSVLQNDYADVFGFTAGEIARMAGELRRESLLPDMKKWYDGYRFGEKDIYNPWSVINCFDQNELGNYWVNTSGNAILGQMLRRLDLEKEKSLLRLLHGESITAAVLEGVIYADIDRDEDALYTLLLLTGYLTAVHKKRGINGLECELRIPNREVQDVFRAEILERCKAGLSVTRLTRMLEDLLQGREKDFADRLGTYLQYLASSFDAANKESFYHGFILGMTALLVPEYIVESNRESGYGRFDVAIFPKNTKKNGVLLEFKTADSEKEMEPKAREALAQIEKKQYAAEFAKRGIAKVWKYGVAFWGKKVQVAAGIK